MFKQSSTHKQVDFFGNFEFNLDKARTDALNDPGAWYNQFNENVTNQLDEAAFSVLFDNQMGRTNASIRVLLAMMALKAGFGWSDAHLYDQVHFNLQVMKALGFVNLSDRAPAPSTYYALKHAVYQYHIDEGRDLIEETFKKLTKAQMEAFEIDGKKIRMDSKLIGSNIVRCSRSRLILSSLREFWKSLSAADQNRLEEADQQILNLISQKKPHKIVFSLSEEGKTQKLSELGYLLFRLRHLYNDSDSDKYFLVDRILNEQYQIDDKDIIVKPAKEVSANSLQSPFDEDAAYRKKGNQRVNGFSVNVTETCGDQKLNLVTDVQVEPATKADKDFAQPAVDNTFDVVGVIDEIYMDGAYQSKETLTPEDTNNIDLIYTGIAGRKGKFEFSMADSELTVYNVETKETILAFEYKPGHYKFKLPSGKWRYIKPAEIESYNRREITEDLPPEIKNRRNNVEATIFQLCFHTRNNKTRYRGQFKHKLWAISRVMWMNFMRIKKYTTGEGISPRLIPAT